MSEMRVASFLGHRSINESDQLKKRLCVLIEKLILEEGVSTFLFGSKSQFDGLCLELVSQIQKRYPHIKRVYVRAEYPVISERYRGYLLENYEETYYPKKIEGAGRLAYVERNFEMIDKSDFCIVYFDNSNAPTTRKSGTRVALDYIIKKKKKLYLFP